MRILILYLLYLTVCPLSLVLRRNSIIIRKIQVSITGIKSILRNDMRKRLKEKPLLDLSVENIALTVHHLLWLLKQVYQT